MLLSRILAVSLLVLSPVAFADSLDINMNNNAASFKYNSSASDLIEGNSELNVGLIYNDSGNMFFDAGLIVRGGEEEGAPGLSVGVGAKGVIGVNKGATTTDTASAIAVGGELVLALPTESRVAFVAEYFASPKIMSFGEAERFNQFGLRMEVEVSPQAKVYLGYREIGFGMKSTGSVSIDRGTHLGVVISF